LIFGPAWDYDISWVKNYPPDAIIGQTIYIWRFDLPASERRWQAGKKNVK